jgi:hypothetical protein
MSERIPYKGTEIDWSQNTWSLEEIKAAQKDLVFSGPELCNQPCLMVGTGLMPDIDLLCTAAKFVEQSIDLYRSTADGPGWSKNFERDGKEMIQLIEIGISKAKRLDAKYG